jgi:DNA repair protein RadC
MKENHIPEKPYERFRALGAGALTDAELLAIILRTGTRGSDAVDISVKVLNLGKGPRQGLLALYDLGIRELMKIPGIGEVKAVKLKCLAELCTRMHEAGHKSGFCASSPASVAEFYMERLRHEKNECVLLISLDSKGRVIRESVISKGSVNRSLAPVRSILLEARDAEAVNIILLHNHPSGDPSPSGDDERLTEKLYVTCQHADLPLIDHIIIGDNTYFSFKESGFLHG